MNAYLAGQRWVGLGHWETTSRQKSLYMRPNIGSCHPPCQRHPQLVLIPSLPSLIRGEGHVEGQGMDHLVNSIPRTGSRTHE